MSRNRTVLSEMNKNILKLILEIKKEHPFWGYRRVWAYIRNYHGIIVNHKRIYRLMEMNNLLCKKPHKNKATRTNMRPKPRADRPNQYWGIDMTKIMISPIGWVYLHVVIDWYTKKIVGWSISSGSKTRLWIKALEMAVMKQFPDGIRNDTPPELISDNGSQPTSLTFAKHCKILGIKQIFTSYSNPKGNADTERVMRTIKEDLVYINEFESKNEFDIAFNNWVAKYNNDFPHSALKYKTPYQVEREYVKKKIQLNSC